ncbi:hypothetical protein IMAU80824_02887 [Lactiplantibacillus plantarum]|nr:hypothetical protein [Lactiplantibacillus plantarum]
MGWGVNSISIQLQLVNKASPFMVNIMNNSEKADI